MQKISPLRAGIEALNKFKKNDNIKQNSAVTNPFAGAFKGKVLQMDVFENSNKLNLKQNTFSFFKRTQDAVLEQYSAIKGNVISFGAKIKSFNPFKYSLSNLQKQPVGELKAMLKAELKGV